MVDHCLSTDRLFCVGTPVSSDQPSVEIGGIGAVSNIATAGLIRACVTKIDGSSHLILHGVARVRLSPTAPPPQIPTDQFPQTALELVPPSGGDCENSAELASSLVSRLDSLGLLDGIDGSFPDGQTCRELSPSALADVVASFVLESTGNRLDFLREPDIPTRLKTAIAFLPGS